jgi:hypothetical protein
MHDCNPVKTPLAHGTVLSRSDMPTTDAEKEEMKCVPYQEAVGLLIYLTVGTWPDLTYTVQVLSHAFLNPRKPHWNAVKHALRYLKGTLDHGITYHGNDTLTPITYLDSSFGDCKDTGRSTNGYIITMAGGPVSWSSKWQDCVTLSTSEAEYITLIHAAKTLIWIENFLGKLHITIECPLQIRGDNQSSGTIANKTINYGRARHINLTYFWLQEWVHERVITFTHIQGAKNLADIMTKTIVIELNNWHIQKLGLVA